MSDRPTRDWGNIADWIQVLTPILVPLFTALLGTLLEIWLGESSPWARVVATALALVCALIVILGFGRIRSIPFRTLLPALGAGVLAESRLGFLTRLLLSGGVGAIELLILYPVGIQTENWWIAIGTTVVAWLVLAIASSNAGLRQLRAEYSTLQDIAERLTNFKTKVLSYPDCDQHSIWENNFADSLDIHTEVLERSGPETCVEVASCEGIERKSIFQHPPYGDDKNDATLRFSGQPSKATSHLALTFYTGVMDFRKLPDGSVDKNHFKPRTGNRIRFQVFVNGRRVFQEVRDSFEWHFHALVLPPPADQLYEVEFRTNALDNSDWNWAVWGEPRLAEWSVVFKDLARLREGRG